MQTHPTDFRAAEGSNETKPAYLYIFKHTPHGLAATSYYLTSYDQSLIVESLPASKGANPQTFTASQVAHTDIEQTSEQNAPATSITVILNDSAEAAALKQYFLTALPNRIDVTIARVNSQALPDNIDWLQDCYTVFRGIKAVISLQGQALIISAINQMLQEDGRVPRYYFQKQCQHDFGRLPCPVDLDTAQFRLSTTIAALNRANRTVDIANTTLNGAAITNTFFIGGKLELLSGSDVINTITIGANEILPLGAGTRLRLLWWDSSLAVALAVRVKRGCLKIVDACVSHGAIADFGGVPKIPVNNPAISGIST